MGNSLQVDREKTSPLSRDERSQLLALADKRCNSIKEKYERVQSEDVSLEGGFIKFLDPLAEIDDIFMYICSFLDKRTLNFGIALCCRHFYVLSRSYSKSFQMSPMIPLLLQIENQESTELKEATLDTVVMHLCTSRWCNWFDTLRLAPSRSMRNEIRFLPLTNTSSRTESEIFKYLFKEEIQDRHIEEILKNCRNLKSINLNLCSSISNKSLRYLGAYGKLQKLNLVHTDITKYGIDCFIESSTNNIDKKNVYLRKIELNCKIGWSGVVNLLNSCTQLESLVLHGQERSETPFFSKDQTGPFTTVKSLTINGWSTEEDLTMIGACFPCLETLRLFRYYSSNYEIISAVSANLSNFPTTITKFVTSNNHICNNSLAVVLKSIFTQFPFLTYLDFQERIVNPPLHGIYDPIFTMVFPQLRVFRLYTHLTDSRFCNTFSHLLSGLTRVDLPDIRLTHMIAICKTAINLESLSVTDIVLTKEFITPFVQQLNNLKYLRKLELFRSRNTYHTLFENHKLHNNLLIEIAESNLKDKLQYFTISHFDNWSMKAIEVWFYSLPYWKSLYVLDMNGCFSFKSWRGEEREHIKNLLRITALYGSFVILHSVK